MIFTRIDANITIIPNEIIWSNSSIFSWALLENRNVASIWRGFFSLKTYQKAQEASCPPMIGLKWTPTTTEKTPCKIENTIDLFFLHRLNSYGWLIYREIIVKFFFSCSIAGWSRRIQNEIKTREKHTAQRLCLGFSSFLSLSLLKKLWSQTIDTQNHIDYSQIIAYQSVLFEEREKRKKNRIHQKYQQIRISFFIRFLLGSVNDFYSLSSTVHSLYE